MYLPHKTCHIILRLTRFGYCQSVIAMAEASQTPLEIRFSDPAEPVFISLDSDLYDTLFLIAASYVQSSQKSSQKPSQARANGNSNMKGKKRPLEDDNSNRNGNVRVVERNREEKRKPMKVAQRVNREPVVREMRPPPVPSPQQAPQPSWAILTAAQQQQQYTNHDYDQEQDDDYRNDQVHYESAGPSQLEVGRGRAAGTGKGKGKEPLFLPSSQLSQLPPAAEAAIIESGLGIENMTAEEFEAMLEGDAEEVEFGEARLKAAPSGADEEDELEDEFQVGGQQWRVEDLDFGQGESGESRDSFELVDDVEMEPTQNGGGFKVRRGQLDSAAEWKLTSVLSHSVHCLRTDVCARVSCRLSLPSESGVHDSCSGALSLNSKRRMASAQ